MRRLSATSALALALLAPGAATAEPRDSESPRFLASFARYTYVPAEGAGTVIADDRTGDTSLLSVAGTAVGAVGAPVGLAYTTGLELGAELEGGFVYDYQIGLGIGAQLGDRVFVAVTGNGGLSGITDDTVPFAWTVSGQAYFGVDAGPVLLQLYGRPTWVFDEDAREDGADIIDFADEASAGLSITSKNDDMQGVFALISGWAFEVFYREAVDTRFIGIGLGVGGSNRPL